ncbi:hypothetical protein [Sporolactobacillus sp. KGMB 08714]|uniref:hypothetical protein n=1 Tax=Sporolactobacillus sp. KGMB 08714 TaxID=3064704 RepID=UPI002FBD3904
MKAIEMEKDITLLVDNLTTDGRNGPSLGGSDPDMCSGRIFGTAPLLGIRPPSAAER